MTDRDVPHYVFGGGQSLFHSPPDMTRPVTAKDVMHQKLSALQPRNRLIQATTTDPLLYGFQLLIDNKILSLPLYSIEKQSYIGFLDVVDIVHHVLNIINEDEIKTGYKGYKDRISSIKCGYISNLSKRNAYKAADTNGTVQAAVDLICHWKVHRVPLVDYSGSLQHIFSQSYIVKILSKYIQLFPFVNKTVGELSFGYKEIITVYQNSTVKQAFELIRDYGISGVGVIDNIGKLCGCLSVSDLRLIGYSGDMFDKFYMKVSKFLKLIGQTRLITVDNTVTVGRVAQIFISTGVHRIFVLDGNDKPIGVISLYDFIMLFDNFT